MISVYSIIWFVFLVFLVFVAECRQIASNSIISGCEFKRLGRNKINFNLRCSSDPRNDISQLFHSNVSRIQCQNGDINLNEISILTVENCELPTLPHQVLSNFKQLTQLQISRVSLKSVQKNELPILKRCEHSLVSLDLSNNNLAHIPNDTFAGQNEVELLTLAENHLHHVDATTFTGLTNVQILNLTSNAITSIVAHTFAAFTQLECLHLSHNQLSTIGELWFGEANELNELDLSYNQITTLKAASFDKLKELSDLNISHSLVAIIEMGAFASLDNLENLDLSHNRLRHFESAAIFTQKTNELMYLYLNDNQLTEWPTKIETILRKLRLFHVENNQFDCVYLQTLLTLLERGKHTFHYYIQQNDCE